VSFVDNVKVFSTYQIQIPYKLSDLFVANKLETSTKTVILELYFNAMGLFVGSWSSMIFYWSFCIQCQEFLSTCGACSEGVFDFERRATYIGSSLKVKLILGPFWHAKMSLTLTMFFIQTSTLLPSRHAPKTY
jgi:hypothetical protein